ncbi:hypothetical protein WMY93_020986 [Mugilogobius chulae]|uniref:Uncharacterized protein n=1 Tax=Mugilogobius chulae TaxID=88201 RepID=A0AAW0NLS0_9GOBI
MKNVWEIRGREYNQKIQQEEERVSKSALPAINKDWASRLEARLGGYKRVERKSKARAEEDETAPAQAKGKKGQEKGTGKAPLLMNLTYTQPSAMVWGKSWKFSKDLPLQEENAAPSNWGQCWMFATQQPFTESGKPWPNGPCKIDPMMLHLCDKPVLEFLKKNLCPGFSAMSGMSLGKIPTEQATRRAVLNKTHSSTASLLLWLNHTVITMTCTVQNGVIVGNPPNQAIMTTTLLQ